MVFFHTKEGPMGPEFQVAYTHPDNVLIDWTDGVDMRHIGYQGEALPPSPLY